LGDRLTVQTIRGIKGNIIGRLPDGRAMLFDQESPYMKMLGPEQLVECNVIHISSRYVIVEPISEPEPFKRLRSYSDEPKPIEEKDSPDIDGDEILEDLRRISEKGEWEIAIMANALIHMIERIGILRSRDHSPRNNDVLVEETPMESPSGSPVSDEFIEAASSFGLIQTEVGESKAPESDFLRYLEGNQE